MGLERLVSEDSRTPLERLRRKQLWDLADAHGISYPDRAPATVMVNILKGAEVDPATPLPSGEKLVQEVLVQDENGKQKVELYPVEKPHATQNKDIDYDSIIEQKAKNSEQAEVIKQQDARIAQMEAMLAKFVGEQSDSQEKPAVSDFSNMKMQELRVEAKKAGINTFGMSKKDIIEKLNA